MMHVWAGLCAVLGTSWPVVAIRAADLEGIEKQLISGDESAWDINSPGVKACGEKLRPIISHGDYRSMFSPIVENTYTFRNKRSDLYLVPDQTGSTTVWDDGKDKSSSWQLAKVKGVKGMPRYTLQNAKSGRFLRENNLNAITIKDCSDTPEACQWELHLYPEDGGFWTLRNILTNHWLANPVQERGVGGSLPVALSNDKTDNASAWLMQAQKLPLFPKRESKAVTQQLEIVKELPLFAGTNVTFGDTCGGIGQITCDAFDAFYTAERKFHMDNGVLLQDDRTKIVTVNQLRQGWCDMAPQMMGVRFRNAAYIKAIMDTQHAASDECKDMDTWGVVASLESAAISECFSSCLDVVVTYANTHDCQTVGEDGFKEILAQDDQCTIMPWLSLEQLTGWAMKKACLPMAPPSPIWVTNDKGVNQIDPVCPVKEGSTRMKDLFRNGTCPEGTRCMCPRLWLVKRQSVSQLRKNGGNLFVTTGSSGIPQFLRVEAMGLVKKVARQAAFVALLGTGLSLSTIAYGVLFSPMSYKPPFLQSLRVLRTIKGWQCQKTAACWPEKPMMVSRFSKAKKACRYDAGLKEGSGSEVWFMPPPGLKLSPHWLSCKVESCSTDELKAQRIGFGPEKGDKDTDGKRLVFNCQPMSFAEMGDDQKRSFLKILENSGVTEEYPDEMNSLDEAYGFRGLQ